MLSILYILGIIGFFIYLRMFWKETNSKEEILSDLFISLFWLFLLIIRGFQRFSPNTINKLIYLYNKIKNKISSFIK